MNPQYNSEYFSYPYKYFVFEDIFLSDEVYKIEQFLSHSILWKLHIEDFYEQYEHKMSRKNEDEYLFFKYGENIKKLLEEGFNVQLSHDYEIVAHKLIEGQHISIHNDSPILGRETHRLVVNLNKDFTDENGGHFYICSERNSNSIEKILRPVSNTGFAFEACKNSYHAVGKVLKQERISLVYSFWHIGNTPGIKANIEKIILTAVKEFSSLVKKQDSDFLHDMKFDSIILQSNNLIDHFIETYSLLKYWKNDDITSELGLFHSILGTIYFRVDKDADDRIKNHLRNRKKLLSLIEKYAVFDINKITLPISKTQEILINVYFANLITGKKNARFTPAIWNSERLLFQRYYKYLTPLCQTDLKNLLLH